MLSRPQVPHDQIVAYLRGESDDETRERIFKLKEKDSAHQLLFELIDKLKSQDKFREKIEVSNVPTTFGDIEELVTRFFSGEAGSEDEKRLTAGLASSPLFYQRLLVKLAPLAPQIAPEIQVDDMKSDEEILEQVKQGVAAKRGRLALSIENILAPLTSKILAGSQNFVDAIVRAPRFAFVMLLAIIGAGVLIAPSALVVYEKLFKDDVFAAYVYDDHVQKPYVASLRGPSHLPAKDSLFGTFKGSFNRGLSDYLLRNYPGAIAAWEKSEPLALALQAAPANEEFLPWIRDYYFCLGFSHFALSRSRRFELKPEEKAFHVEQAIEFLAHADSLAAAHALEGNDRETFFLGLAYGFGGRRDSALSRLQKIKPESHYYQQAIAPVREWSKQ